LLNWYIPRELTQVGYNPVWVNSCRLYFCIPNVS